MGDNVTPFSGVTRLDMAPDTILGAASGQLESCVVVGFTKDGEFYFASSLADAAEAIFLFERAKYRLMQTVDDLESGSDG